MVKLHVKRPSFLKLLASVLIDLAGNISYIGNLIGLIGGEITDSVFAPISAMLVYLLYRNETIAWINGIEEILPYTDIIPTATIGWFYERFRSKRDY